MTLNDGLSFLWDIALNFLSAFSGKISFFLQVKLFGVKYQSGFICYGGVVFRRGPLSKISLGKNLIIVSSSRRCSSASLYAKTKLQTFQKTAQILIGDDVHLNGTSIVARSKKIIIGSGTIIAPNVMIIDSDFHVIWPPENRGISAVVDRDQDVIIGENVWIGARSIILKGVTIGTNSIIGAGSVVTKNVDPNCLYAGNPAKKIKSLSTDA